MPIKFFSHIQKENNIANRANEMAPSLPLLGNARAENEIYLCHYSDNPNIQKFINNQICGWLDGITVSGKKLVALTHIPNKAVINTLYLIRVGLSGSELFDAPEFSAQHSKGGASEYAITFDVLPNEFATIPLIYDPASDSYI